MKELNVEPGTEVYYQNRKVFIKRLVDLHTVLVEDLLSHDMQRVAISLLEPVEQASASSGKEKPLESISEEEWKTAKKRLTIIKPLLTDRTTQEVEKVAKQHKITKRTIFRWLKQYSKTGTTVSLVDRKGGGKGKRRLSTEIETIVDSVIEHKYLSDKRDPIISVIREVQYLCYQSGLKAPHPNCIRQRIYTLDDYKTMKRRKGRKRANETYGAQHPKNEENYLLKVVEMDHTPVDVILVDEKERITLGRPYITVAIETFSRVILGYYLSFNHPSAYVNALCIANAILPKDKLMEDLKVDAHWPFWGKMHMIRTDNGKDFHSKAFNKACEKHSIHLEWRLLGEPKAGGSYIESYLGNFSAKLQEIPGKTFRNVKERDGYKSEEKAVMSLPAFEQWLVNLIAVYHHEKHEGIGMSPVKKYEEGVFGSQDAIGVGFQPKLLDAVSLKLDFMPYEERTIQQYGVMINHIRYWGPELNIYIHAVEPGTSKKKGIKRKFIFKYDPRDISIIYFLNPDSQEYIAIYYGDTTKPRISIWEQQEAMRLMKERGVKSVDEDTIFRHIAEMRRIIEDETRQTKLHSRKKKALRRSAKPAIHQEFMAQKEVPATIQQKYTEEEDEIFSNTEPLKIYDTSK